MNDQRLVMYAQRLEIMDAEDIGDLVEDVVDQAARSVVQTYVPARHLSQSMAHR